MTPTASEALRADHKWWTTPDVVWSQRFVQGNRIYEANEVKRDVQGVCERVRPFLSPSASVGLPLSAGAVSGILGGASAENDLREFAIVFGLADLDFSAIANMFSWEFGD